MFIHPALPLLLASLLTLVRGKTPLQRALHLIAPVLAFSCLYPYLPKEGLRELHRLTLPFAGYNRVILKTDTLALFLSVSLLLYAQVSSLFSFQQIRKLPLIGHYLSIGASLGILLSGDLLVLFVFWVILAAANFLAVKNPDEPWNFHSLYQPLLPRAAGIVFFALALILRGAQGQSLSLGPQPLDTAGVFLFAAFTVTFLLPVLSLRLSNENPPPSTQVDLNLFGYAPVVSLFAFQRCYAGVDWLLCLGVLTVTLGILFSWVEKDLRKLIFYLLLTQTGLVLTGAGIGSDLGLNGADCHLAGTLFFGAVLLMSAGRLRERTGSTHVSTLGTLGGKNRDLLGLMLMGSLALAGLPGLIGHAGQSLLLHAAGTAGLDWAGLLIRAVQAFAFLTLVLKVLEPAWSGAAPQKKKAPVKVPVSTLMALSAAALLCILPGLAPKSLLDPFLPYPVSVPVFEPIIILHTLQLFLGAWACDAWLKKKTAL